MIRTQISLTEGQMRRLKAAAGRRGVSMATLIREAVDEVLDADPDDRERLKRRALEAIGKGRDREGKSDVARRHDDYLTEALTEEFGPE